MVDAGIRTIACGPRTRGGANFGERHGRRSHQARQVVLLQDEAHLQWSAVGTRPVEASKRPSRCLGRARLSGPSYRQTSGSQGADHGQGASRATASFLADIYTSLFMTSDDEVDGALSVVVQLAVIVCLVAIAIWAWPKGMLTRPMSSLTIASVFWALLSSAMWIVALGRLYFSVTPLFKRNSGQPYDHAS